MISPVASGGQRHPVDAAALRAELRALGLDAEDRVVVHCSLRALGPIDGGARAVIEALQEILTEEGLLLVPTFNHGAPFSPGREGVYDPRVTPSENGALSDWFWRSVGVHRSEHPTHPFAAWGRGAREIVRSSDPTRPIGPDSPLGRLADQGGRLLHLGTTHEVSTAKHLAETLAGAACLGDFGDTFLVRLEDGSLTRRGSWRYRGRPCPLTDRGGHLERSMEEAQVEVVGPVGHSLGRLVALADFLAVTRALLERGAPGAPPCRACSIRPSARAEGDWA